MARSVVRSLLALALLGAVACAPGNAQLENEIRDLNQKVQSLENRLRRIEGMASKAGKGKAGKGKAAKGKAGKGKAGKGKAGGGGGLEDGDGL